MHWLVWSRSNFRLVPNQSENSIVFTICWLIWNRLNFNLFPNLSENSMHSIYQFLIGLEPIWFPFGSKSFGIRNVFTVFWLILNRSDFRLVPNQSENSIVFTIFWLIWNRSNFRLDPNQSENSKYNPILVYLIKFKRRLLCM